MTNQEFFLKVLTAEQPIFENILKEVPADKLAFKPHEKARTTGSLASQLAAQFAFMAEVAVEGVPDWSKMEKITETTAPIDMLAAMERGFDMLKNNVAKVSIDQWENGTAAMVFPGGKWETKKYDMVWGFLFDAIHHRGQLSTYLRILGARVPSIYGGSADVPAGA